MGTDYVPNVLSEPDGENTPQKYIKLIVNNIVPFVTPFLFACIYEKHKTRLSEQRKKYEEEVQHLQLALSNTRAQQESSHVQPSIKLQDLMLILNEEEKEQEAFLTNLAEVKREIKKVLHVRCSKIKSKSTRIELEESVLNNTESGLHQGLTNIFSYDHEHCGGGFDGNGQLWRVWLKAWTAQAEAKKYRNVIQRLEAKLKP